MSTNQELKSVFQGRKVLVTGHNGFKGTWLTLMLIELGADVFGISLENTESQLYKIQKQNTALKFEEKNFDIREKKPYSTHSRP